MALTASIRREPAILPLIYVVRLARPTVRTRLHQCPEQLLTERSVSDGPPGMLDCVPETREQRTHSTGVGAAGLEQPAQPRQRFARSLRGRFLVLPAARDASAPYRSQRRRQATPIRLRPLPASRPPLTRRLRAALARRLRASLAPPTTLPNPETALDQPPGLPVHPRIGNRTSTNRDFAARSLPRRGHF